MNPPPRMTKAAAAIEELAEEARQTVTFLSRSIVQICKDNQLKPGWAMLGVCEFLSLMVHQNQSPDDYEEEIARFGAYIRDRLKEFNEHTAKPH